MTKKVKETKPEPLFTELFATPSMWIHTGIYLLNLSICKKGGGWPCGRLCEVAGEPADKKTTLGLYAIKSTQLAGGKGIFIDTERKLDTSLTNLVDVDTSPDKFTYLPNKENELLTLEDTLTYLLDTVKKLREDDSDPLTTIVWDSVPSVIPESGLDDPIKLQIGSVARVISVFMSGPFMKYISGRRVLVLVINQLRDNVNFLGAKTSTYGGRALKYNGSVRVVLSTHDDIRRSSDNHKVGEECGFKILRTNFGPPTDNKFPIRWRFMYGHGIDDIGTMIDFCIKNKTLPMAGAYVKWSDSVKAFKADIINTIANDVVMQRQLMELTKETWEATRL